MSDTEIPPTGLLPETERSEEPRHKSERDLMVERIAARHAAAREAELALGQEMDAEARANGLTLDTYVEPDESEAGETSNPAAPTIGNARQRPEAPPAEQAPQQQQPTTQATPPPEMFAVEVDGQQFHVSREQMTTLAKMGMLTNRTILEYQQQQRWQQQQPAEAPKPQREEKPLTDLTRDVVKRIQFSTEDDAAQALHTLVEDVVARNRAQAINPQEIEARATQKALLLMQGQQVDAIIRQEYADILADPDLSHLAHLKAGQIRQELAMMGRTASDLDVLREAGNRVRQRFNMAPPQQQQQQAAPEEIRVRPRDTINARKREAPRQIASSAMDVRSPAPQQERAPSGSDIVAAMKKARGQKF